MSPTLTGMSDVPFTKKNLPSNGERTSFPSPPVGMVLVTGVEVGVVGF